MAKYTFIITKNMKPIVNWGGLDVLAHRSKLNTHRKQLLVGAKYFYVLFLWLAFELPKIKQERTKKNL